MTQAAAEPNGPPYISVDELIALRSNPHLVLLDARISRSQRPDGSAHYASGWQSFREDGHIPGAVFADLFEAFSDPDAPFAFTRPSAAALSGTLAAHGIDGQSVVVVYDCLNGVWAARLWWVLKAAGLADVRLLNGGLSAWKAQGGPLAFGEGTSAVPVAPTALTPDSELFVALPDVLALTAEPASATLVCALRQADFEAGHIPGSKCLAYPALLTADGLIDPRLAEKTASALGLSRSDRLVLYCGGGVNAAGVGIALRAAGFNNVSVYDGSLSEWKADPSRPLATGPASQ